MDFTGGLSWLAPRRLKDARRPNGGDIDQAHTRSREEPFGSESQICSVGFQWSVILADLNIHSRIEASLYSCHGTL